MTILWWPNSDYFGFNRVETSLSVVSLKNLKVWWLLDSQRLQTLVRLVLSLNALTFTDQKTIVARHYRIMGYLIPIFPVFSYVLM